MDHDIVTQYFRYFSFDGKPCRALPHTDKLKGEQHPQLQN
jgi:hypothetical protein